MTNASDRRNAGAADGGSPPERTWAADIEEELPALLDEIERAGAEALDEESCAHALVLAGRAAQLRRDGDRLDVLFLRIRAHVPSLLRRASFPSPDVLIERTDLALAGREDPVDGPLDALLDDDDWLTVQGAAQRWNMPSAPDTDCQRLTEAVSALVSLRPDRVAPLAAFAEARIEGLSDRAHEAFAWRALMDVWRAVLESPLGEAAATLPVSLVPSPAAVDAVLTSVLARHSVWSTPEDVQPRAEQYVHVIYARDVVVQQAHASGTGLPAVKDAKEIARWGDCRLILTAGGPDLHSPILQLDGRRSDQTVDTMRDGAAVRFDVDEFDAEIAEALPGRYRVTVNGAAVEFELRERPEEGKG